MTQESLVAVESSGPKVQSKVGRAKQLFIYHPDFDDRKFWRRLVADPPVAEDMRASRKPPAGTQIELQHLWDIPLLSPAQEIHLFRKYNFLRYKTVCQTPVIQRAYSALNAVEPDSPVRGILVARYKSALNKEASLIERCDEVRNQIMEANLRLVVNPSKKQLSWLVATSQVAYEDSTRVLWELISDGNSYLLNAIDGFNYNRGFKFSTYAINSIVKNFRNYHVSARYCMDSETVAATLKDHRDNGAAERAAESAKVLVGRLLDTLEDERQRRILEMRFLEDKTLKEVGDILGVTRERIRQIESDALGKLQRAYQRAPAELSRDSFFLSPTG